MKPLILIALLVSAAPAFADNAESNAKKDKDDPNKIVCIKEAEIGSHFTRRVCKTSAQWKDERAQAREEVKRAQNTQLNPQGH